MKFSELKGKTVSSIKGCRQGSDEIIITLDTGERFRMYHEQDCCEYVYVEDVCGDTEDLVGTPIVLAEEVSSEEGDYTGKDECCLWTFYKIDTAKGGVVIRWCGESNGYYSVSVTFKKI